MSYQLRTIKTFDNELKQLSKRHHSLKADILQLGKELQGNPLVGADLGHGVRKVRLAIASFPSTTNRTNQQSPTSVSRNC